MSGRQFPLRKFQVNGVVRSFPVIICSSCGAEEKFRHNKQRTPPSEVVTPKFERLGWSVGSRERDDQCPDCVAKAAAAKAERSASVVEPEPVRADPPREMTREDRRIVIDKLSDVYLDDRSGYAPPWTDAAVARDLGVPRAWVSEIRDYAFGPAGSNADLDAFVEAIAPLKQDVDQHVTDCRARFEAAKALAERVAGLESTAARVLREIGR